MKEIERYLAEEIATDYGDGIVNRREALRRLALLGLEVGAASALLAACSSTSGPATTSSAGPHASAAPSAAASASSAPSASASAPQVADLPPSTPTTAITFAGAEARKLQGAWATADAPHGAILVIHENKGLTPHIMNVAGRLAAAGFAALAIDLLSEEGGTASLGDPANATAALGKVQPDRFVADMRSGLDELAKRAPGKKLGAMGFCFGGGMTWRLVGAKDDRLRAAIPFYGPFPEGADFKGTKAAVMAMYAALDKRVNGTKDTAESKLKEAGATYEINVFDGADHAFFNDTRPEVYDPSASNVAFADTVELFRTLT